MVSSPDPGMRSAKRKMKYEQYMSQSGIGETRRQSEIADDDTKDTKNLTFKSTRVSKNIDKVPEMMSTQSDRNFPEHLIDQYIIKKKNMNPVLPSI